MPSQNPYLQQKPMEPKPASVNPYQQAAMRPRRDDPAYQRLVARFADGLRAIARR